MDLDLFKYLFNKIIKETSQYNSVTFSGIGEPLLDETINEKISYVKKHNFKVLIVTNGSLLTLTKFKGLDDLGVDVIRISLYGDDILSYNKVHGIRNPVLFNKIKDKLTEIAKNRRTLELRLCYNVIDDTNANSVDSWIAYWKDKVDSIEVWRPHNWVDGRDYRKLQKKKLKTCGRPYRTPLQVEVDGTVNMCCFDFNGKLLLGDLKVQSLAEIFQGPMFKKILKCHTSGNFKGSGLICEKCDQRNADKSNILIYSSKFDTKERVNMFSTVYANLF